MTGNQIAGILRALGPVFVAYLVQWGLPAETAGPFVDWAIVGAVAAASAAWSWLSNRRTAVVQQAAQTPGVLVQVAPEKAPPAVVALADDDAHSNVVRV